MKLLTALKRLPADNCVILTYNADLPFFEYIVFESLYAAGCRNTMLLCDPAQYELAVQDTPMLRYAGQRYLLLPGRTSPTGAFHPKLILLTSTKRGRLFVSSSNLTRAGYTRNWEVVTLFEYNARNPDPAAWVAFRWAFDALTRIVEASDADRMGHQHLDQLLGTTPWLRQESPIPVSVPVWPLHNLDEPLLDQVFARYRQGDGSPIGEVVVVSPFFDTGARAVDRLLSECRPQRLRLFTQANGHRLNPRALRSVLEHHDLEAHLSELNLEGRWLHAKVLLMRTQRGAWLASGSANLSAPAWLHRAATGNTEIVTLRFENNPAYFDPWLEELTANARPLDLDWDEEPSKAEPEPPQAVPSIVLSLAMLRRDRLVLQLTETLPDDAVLTVYFAGDEPREAVYRRWHQETDFTLTLRLAPQFLPYLEIPALVTLEAATPSDTLRSNSVLLHNLSSIRRFSRPVRRRERPRVPEGIVPESYEHCAQLLEMLHELLATNSEQLHRHRGRIARLTKMDQQEQQMAVEEEGEYAPEEHFVDEQIRLATTRTGADLYADFYDRLTYEELLRAALAAVYHPLPTVTDDRPDTFPPDYPPPRPEKPPKIDDAELQAKVMARIKRGFKRLVGNFAEGTSNAEYLTEVPPRYLLELCVIISAYLRVVWRDGMLSEKLFLELSLSLLTALWGEPGQPSAWSTLCSRLTDEELEQEKARLALVEQVWLHAYVVAELLVEADDRRIYDLAAWMRQFRRILGKSDVLESLPDLVYRRLWRASSSPTVEVRSAAEVANHLWEISQWYDEASLLKEISAWPGARARTSVGTIAGETEVPKLEVTLALSKNDIDRCLRAFTHFLAWPQPKPFAWARFANTNPLADPDDLKSAIFFYRGDKKSLVFAVKRASGPPRPDWDVNGITVKDLGGVRSTDELRSLESAELVVHN
jgi:hypothetical protein